MAFCENCGTPLNGTAKFCPNCGAQTPLGLSSGDNIDDEEILNNEQEYEEGEKQEFDVEAPKQQPVESSSLQNKSKGKGCLKKAIIAYFVIGFLGFLAEEIKLMKCLKKWQVENTINNTVLQ